MKKLIVNLWGVLSRPSKMALGLLLGGGFIAGAVFFIIFHFTMSATNSMDLCISCHEMDGVYEEYKKTPHYSSASGVRATCADCHVPHGKTFPDWLSKIYVKATIGTKDIYHHLMGTYDTKEKFQASRYEMAQNVIKHMRERDSKECRFCHSLDAMNLAEQGKSASRKHKRIMESGDKTCIDCHTGIAHEEPEEPEDPEE
ncbi:MAG: NapC/NirT family cytochrome c [Magnetococcales bacterium]|nr:NapC/NirT family cytochrome c [Magnetococcales bacterium]